MTSTIQTASNLADLLDLITSADVDETTMTELPTFGGERPAKGPARMGVWSWDETKMIVGTCRADYEIVDRADYE